MRRDHLTYGELREFDVPLSLRAVWEELERENDIHFISTHLAESYPSYETIDYSGAAINEVLNAVNNMETLSNRQDLPEGMDHPLLLYHHGSRGLSDENYLMAEYLASMGFIFVAANFHLPYANSPFGLKEGVEANPSRLRALLEFSRSITSSHFLCLIGHSWGAQSGWVHIEKDMELSAFVSIETTIEFKRDSAEVKDKWPFVYERIQHREPALTIPVLLLANTRTDEVFHFFQHESTETAHHVSAREDFGHESYTALFHMRHLLRTRWPQPDEASMAMQLSLYIQHVELIRDYLESLYKGVEFDSERHRGFFILNQTNP